MDYFLVPLTFYEFLDWYNRGNRSFVGLRFIPVHLETASSTIEVDQAWKERLIRSIPEYDEDFQVLIALVRTNRKKYEDIEEKSTGKTRRAPAYTEVPIDQLQGLYPISARGKRLLQSRISSEVVLGDPLFEEDIREKERRRARRMAYQGGDALLEYYCLTESITKREIEPLKEEIWNAVDRKVNKKESEVESSSFVLNLVVYDRYDKPDFPRTQLGYVYDYFSVVNEVVRKSVEPDRRKEIVNDVLRPIRLELDKLRGSVELVSDIIGGPLRTHFKNVKEIGEVDAERYPPWACVLFLSLREELRQNDALGQTSTDAWVETLRKEGREYDLAVGLWMVGAFFGLSKFADEYYAESLEPPFMKEPPNRLACAEASRA